MVSAFSSSFPSSAVFPPGLRVSLSQIRPHCTLVPQYLPASAPLPPLSRRPALPFFFCRSSLLSAAHPSCPPALELDCMSSTSEPPPTPSPLHTLQKEISLLTRSVCHSVLVCHNLPACVKIWSSARTPVSTLSSPRLPPLARHFPASHRPSAKAPQNLVSVQQITSRTRDTRNLETLQFGDLSPSPASPSVSPLAIAQSRDSRCLRRTINEIVPGVQSTTPPDRFIACLKPSATVVLQVPAEATPLVAVVFATTCK
ncbi:hypothetical protein B0T14DRAFT_37471 [Immersiella caudata]|uniref:Uncharacterized protein n=1 Tax=Immersiella caudata TaxID=314043 RepID=A0AA40CBF2_9PEZI|nr:hypothetical protein B0T14DRAFT_37471 [Immersiella caudata]